MLLRLAANQDAQHIHRVGGRADLHPLFAGGEEAAGEFGGRAKLRGLRGANPEGVLPNLAGVGAGQLGEIAEVVKEALRDAQVGQVRQNRDQFGVGEGRRPGGVHARAGLLGEGQFADKAWHGGSDG